MPFLLEDIYVKNEPVGPDPKLFCLLLRLVYCILLKLSHFNQNINYNSLKIFVSGMILRIFVYQDILLMYLTTAIRNSDEKFPFVNENGTPDFTMSIDLIQNVFS